MARNVFLMNRRVARQWAKIHESREDLPEFPVLPEADRLGSQDEIRRGLAHLSPDQVEALLLHYEGGSFAGHNCTGGARARRGWQICEWR